MNQAALISRINKAINKIETVATLAKVHLLSIDDKLDDLTGLVVIFSPETQPLTVKPKTTKKQPTQAKS